MIRAKQMLPEERTLVQSKNNYSNSTSVVSLKEINYGQSRNDCSDTTLSQPQIPRDGRARGATRGWIKEAGKKGEITCIKDNTINKR